MIAERVLLEDAAAPAYQVISGFPAGNRKQMRCLHTFWGASTLSIPVVSHTGGPFTSLNLPNLTPPVSINTHFCFSFFLCLTPAGSSSWLPSFLQGQECCEHWRRRHFCNKCPLTDTVRVAGFTTTTVKGRWMVRLDWLDAISNLSENVASILVKASQKPVQGMHSYDHRYQCCLKSRRTEST